MPETISKSWNTDLNYWDLHPIMKTFKVFNDLYKADKSKKKDKSSKIMWAIALAHDPHEENTWYRVNPADKKKLISEEYLEQPDFDWEDIGIQTLIEGYLNLTLTTAEKELFKLERKMAERGDFIDKTPYSLDYYEEDTGRAIKGTADQLDKMMANTDKIWTLLDKAKATLSAESMKTRLRGDVAESATDEGKI